MTPLRQILRSLQRDRSFAIAALLTLTICVACNTAVLAVVQSVLLKSLPIRDADRVVLIANTYPKVGLTRAGPDVLATSPADYFVRRRGLAGTSEQALFRRRALTFSFGDTPIRVTGIAGTPSFYSLVGATAQTGRSFGPQDGEVGSDDGVVLSQAFWELHAGGSASTIGSFVTVDGARRRVIGVMSPEFRFLWDDVDVWLPAAFTPEQQTALANGWAMIARLDEGGSVQSLERDLNQMNAAAATGNAAIAGQIRDGGLYTRVSRLKDAYLREARPALYLVWGGAVLVLLMGALNLATLTAARAAVRSREAAIRLALGGRPAQISAALLLESITIGTLGATFGVLAGWWLLNAADLLHIELLPRGRAVHLDWLTVCSVVVAAIGISAVAAIAPIARFGRASSEALVRDGARGATRGPGFTRTTSILVSAQVCVTFVLVAGAGVLVASLRAVRGLDTGFRAAGVMTSSIVLPVERYPDNTAIASGVERILASLRGAPGVAAAGATFAIPFGGAREATVVVPEGFQPNPEASFVVPLLTTATPDYFDAMGIPVTSGRAFEERDQAGALQVAIVDERLARLFWPGVSAVGKRVYFPRSTSDVGIDTSTQLYSVVGVAADVAITGLTPDDPLVGTIYFPVAQRLTRALVLAVRTSAPEATAASAMRRAVAAVDPAIPVFDQRSMTERVDRSLVTRQVPMVLAGLFGTIATTLAAVGIFGMLAYRAAQRRREMSIRLALGSTSARIVALMLRDAIRVVAPGLVAGCALVAALSPLVRSQLFGVQPLDPTVMLGAAVFLVVCGLSAAIVPAVRAGRADPAATLGE